MTSPRVTPVAYRDGYKYQLAANYHFQTTLRQRDPIVTAWITLDREGQLTILAGYAWDGPSGPTVDSACAMRASLVHDALYQLIGLHLLPTATRAHADRIFLELCEADGMGLVRRTVWHRMVRWFGPKGGSDDKPVRYAPR